MKKYRKSMEVVQGRREEGDWQAQQIEMGREGGQAGRQGTGGEGWIARQCTDWVIKGVEARGKKMCQKRKR